MPDADAAQFRDALRARTPHAFVTPALLGLNAAVFIVMVASGVHPLNPDAGTLLTWGGNYGPRTTNGEWWRLITSTFVHAGFIHLAANAIGLLQVGMVVERLVGNFTFLALYLVTGVLASLASLSVHPGTVSVGASGAIFGIYGLGLAALLAGNVREAIEDDLMGRGAEPIGLGLSSNSPEANTAPEPDVTPPAGQISIEALKPLRASVASFVLYNISAGFGQAHVDNAAHVGGLAAGLLCGWVGARNVAADKPRPRRIALVVAGASLLVLGAAVQLRGIDDLQSKDMDALETRINDTFNNGMTQVRAETMTAEAMTGVIEHDVLPQVRLMRARLRALEKLPAEHLALRAVLQEYWGLREESLRLLAEGLREDSENKVIESGKKAAAAEAVAKKLQQGGR